MKRIDTANKAVNLFGSGKHGFKAGVVGTSARPTNMAASWCNALQEEIASVIEGESIVLDGGMNTQLKSAIGKMIDRKLTRLDSFGPIVGDGSTNDLSTWQAAAASSAKFIDARGYNCMVDGQVDGGSGQRWLLDGTTIHFTGADKIILNFDTKTDFAIVGPFTMVGDGTTIGTAKAIRIKDCSRAIVDAPTVRTVKGWGVYIEPGSSTTDRGDHCVIRNLRADQCYIGYEDVPGTGAEYVSLLNPHITRSTSWAVKTSAGNLIWSNPNIVDNANGVLISGGSNHAHCIFSSGNINHSTGDNIKLDGVSNGATFVGVHCYGDSDTTGIIHLLNSGGFTFIGGTLDASIACDGAVGYSLVASNFCPDTSAAQVHGGSTPKKVIYVDNVTPNGPWKLNDKGGFLFVKASRSGSAQTIANANTTLIADTEAVDTRDSYDASTGVFTAPWKGVFKISHAFRVVGTGLADGYAEIRRNGTAIAFAPIVAFSSITAVCTIAAEVECDIGDTLDVRSIMPTGTGMTYDSSGSHLTVAQAR